MKNFIVLILTIVIVGCTESPKPPEKYGFEWESMFLSDNRGISLLCKNNNNNNNVSFFVMSEKKDWQNIDERKPGNFRAKLLYISYVFYDDTAPSWISPYEVYKSGYSFGRDLIITPKEMIGSVDLKWGRAVDTVILDRESLTLTLRSRYGGDGALYWEFLAQCEISNNINIAIAIDDLKNRAKEKMIAFDQIRQLEVIEQEKKNKL